MQKTSRLIAIVFSIIAVVAILVVWKKGDRKRALSELATRFGAEVSIAAGEFYVGCSSPDLIDLNGLADLVARVGEPTILDLTGAPSLKSLSGIQKMPSLSSIVLIDCASLTTADGVSGHPSLTEIVLTDSVNFAGTAEIRDLPSLTTLDFSGCLALSSIEIADLPALENLYLSRCRKLERLDLAPFPQLRQLYVDGCGALAAMEGLGGLGQLTDLDVSNATTLSGLPGVGGLTELIVLDIRNVEVKDFSGIAALPKLRVLRMGGQEAIETLEPFAGLSSLRELHLEACPNLRSLGGMPSGISQYAGFTYCPKLLSLAGLESATGLEQLDVVGSENLADISSVAALGSLVQLNLVKCRQVTDIKFVEKMPKLAIVMLGGSGVIPSAVEGLNLANKDIIFDFAASE